MAPDEDIDRFYSFLIPGYNMLHKVLIKFMYCTCNVYVVKLKREIEIPIYGLWVLPKFLKIRQNIFLLLPTILRLEEHAYLMYIYNIELIGSVEILKF